MRIPLGVILALLASAGLTSPAGGQESDSRLPAGSSVGNGDGPAPSFSTAVRRAAKRGGCTVRSFRSDGYEHAGAPFAFAQSPPTSGTHATRWADWGVYVRRYRGTGPEQAPAINSSTERPGDLPAPAQPAEQPEG